MFNKRRQKSGGPQAGRQEPRVTEPAGQDTEAHGAQASGAQGREQAGAGQPHGQAAPARQPSPRPDPSAVLNRQPTPPVRPDAARRSAAGAAQSARAQGQGQDQPDSKKLLVGREISLSGEIKACETLVVEGTVEAELNGTKLLDIQPSGLFKGSAMVDTAEVAGRFEGDLVVRERLYVRATGHVHGTIKYRGMEIESGGRIGGTLTELSEQEAQEAAAGSAPAAAQAGEAAGHGAGEAPDRSRLNGQGSHAPGAASGNGPAATSGSQ